MDVKLAKVIQEISDDIVRAVREVMSSDVGINDKVGINTLHGSNLYRQIKQSWKEDGENVVIDTIFNHYLEYIEWDRPPKYGRRPPVKEIIKWLRRKHIVSSNENIKSVAYAVSLSIWRNGWKGRKVLETLDKYVDNGFDEKYADMLFEAIMEETEKYFN